MASFDRSAGQALHSISAWPSCPTSSTWSSDALRITHLVVTRRRPSLLFPDCSLGQRGPGKDPVIALPRAWTWRCSSIHLAGGGISGRSLWRYDTARGSTRFLAGLW